MSTHPDAPEAWTMAPVASLQQNASNPRTIRDERFRKLVESLKSFPAMLRIRPIVVNASGVVIGGNQRLLAARAAGLIEVPIIRVSLSPEQEREFVIRDNAGSGDWDWDALANEWDPALLNDWGLDVPEVTMPRVPADDEPGAAGDDEGEPVVCPHCAKTFIYGGT